MGDKHKSAGALWKRERDREREGRSQRERERVKEWEKERGGGHEREIDKEREREREGAGEENWVSGRDVKGKLCFCWLISWCSCHMSPEKGDRVQWNFFLSSYLSFFLSLSIFLSFFLSFFSSLHWLDSHYKTCFGTAEKRHGWFSKKV